MENKTATMQKEEMYYDMNFITPRPLFIKYEIRVLMNDIKSLFGSQPITFEKLAKLYTKTLSQPWTDISKS